jgi:predicted dehydrogenase
VTVTAATSAHRAIMVRAAQAGKHIFTEKLLAPTVNEAEEIIGVADEAGVALVVSLPRLYHGYTSAIRRPQSHRRRRHRGKTSAR